MVSIEVIDKLISLIQPFSLAYHDITLYPINICNYNLSIFNNFKKTKCVTNMVSSVGSGFR
jgi:hypothetical protein